MLRYKIYLESPPDIISYSYLIQIEAGEGANTALTQLKQENEGLAERLQSANQG